MVAGFQTRFEPRKSKMQSKRANHQTTIFGPCFATSVQEVFDLPFFIFRVKKNSKKKKNVLALLDSKKRTTILRNVGNYLAADPAEVPDDLNLQQHRGGNFKS
jgi:hypothetical protein